MKKLLDPEIFPILSFLISAIFGLVTWRLGFSPSASLGLGFLMHLVLIIQFMLGRIGNIESLLGKTKALLSVSDLIPKINNIYRSENAWSKKLLELRVQKFSLDLSYIDNNRSPLTPAEFIEFSELLFSSLNSKDTLEATSLFGGGNYWVKKYGKRYGELNENASNNGAKIIRTFIPRNQDHYLELENIFHNQSKYCSVLVGDYDDIRELDSGSLKDFFILNNQLVVEFVFNSDFSDLQHIDVITSPDEINLYRKRMNTIISASKPYVPKK